MHMKKIILIALALSFAVASNAQIGSFIKNKVNQVEQKVSNNGNNNTQVNGWTCPKCGATGNTGSACKRCGAKKPSADTPANNTSSSKVSSDGSWDCPVCGHKGNHRERSYCVNCGASKPAPPAPEKGWQCPSCGQKGNEGKFCDNCGTAKPEAPKAAKPAPAADEWTCRACGHKHNTGKFCTSCGAQKPDFEGEKAAAIAFLNEPEPEVPWCMNYELNSKTGYILNERIISMSENEARVLREKMDKRLAYDNKLIDIYYNTQLVPKAKYDTCAFEVQCYFHFLSSVASIVYHGYSGEIEEENNKLVARTKSVHYNGVIKVYKKDGVCNFYYDYGVEKTYLEPNDVEDVKKYLKEIQIIKALLQSDKTMDDVRKLKAYKDDAESALCGYVRACETYQFLTEALANNDIKYLRTKPMPVAGKMQASLKAKAFALAKAKETGPELIDIVITSDDWAIVRNDFGTILRRQIRGFVIWNKKGISNVASECYWYQEFEGNNYGSLKYGGTYTNNSFYVK